MSEPRLELTIINAILTNSRYCEQVAPHIKPEYFDQPTENAIVRCILDFIARYHAAPSKDSLIIDLEGISGIKDKELSESKALVEALPWVQSSETEEWLLDKTETFFRDKAIYNALYDSVAIIDDRDPQKRSKGAIPQILENALGVTLDNKVGHDYLADAKERFEAYHKTESRVSFGLTMMDKISRGGMAYSSLTVILAGTGGGKSLFMCSTAASILKAGLNVLYITMEMAEERIAERIDANLMDMSMDELYLANEAVYASKISSIKSATNGRLIIKEYPTGAAHAGNFRALIHELKFKKQFVPNIIVVDYLNICSSQRVRMGSNVNTYTLLKSVSEELRSLAMEFSVPVLTATQTNRGGYSSSDIQLEDTGESWGITTTADLMFALSTGEKLDSMGQVMVKQLKNRYSDPNMNKRFLLGMDKKKMRVYDLEDAYASDVTDPGIPTVLETGTKVRTQPMFQGFKF